MIHVNTVLSSLTRSVQPEMKRQVDLSRCVQPLVTFLSLQWHTCNGKHLEISCSVRVQGLLTEAKVVILSADGIKL